MFFASIIGLKHQRILSRCHPLGLSFEAIPHHRENSGWLFVFADNVFYNQCALIDVQRIAMPC
jgi:hypothetical protein